MSRGAQAPEEEPLIDQDDAGSLDEAVSLGMPFSRAAQELIQSSSSTQPPSVYASSSSSSPPVASQALGAPRPTDKLAKDFDNIAIGFEAIGKSFREVGKKLDAKLDYVIAVVEGS